MIILINNLKNNYYFKKETNYSQNHVFLDIDDDINNMYIINLIDNDIITIDITPNKNAVVTACNRKYFKDV